mgnify:FL=1
MDSTSFQNRFFYNWWRSIDRKVLICIFFLIIIGGLISFAATPAVAQKYNLDPNFFVKKHWFFIPVVLFSIFFTSLFSELGIKRFFLFIFLISIFFIIYFFFFGIEVKGANRWSYLFGYRFQPSEFLKVSFIVISAWIFSSNTYLQNLNNKLISFLLYLLVSSLVLSQPDVSMFCIISLAYFAQLWISGLKWRWLGFVVLFFGSIFSLCYLIIDNVKRRVDIFFNLQVGDNYQITKSLEAIKEGGFFGKGPAEGTIKDILPDAHTDFIFAVVAEEFGWITCLIIIFIFIFLIFTIFQRIKKTNNMFALITVSGLIIQFGFQIFVNIGSTIGLIPTTGTTLPFISYGGSSMISSAINLGTILSLTRIKYINAFEQK